MIRRATSTPQACRARRSVAGESLQDRDRLSQFYSLSSGELPRIARIDDVAAWLGRKRPAACRFLADLEASYGLKRKARGSRPYWLWPDILAAVDRMDTR